MYNMYMWGLQLVSKLASDREQLFPGVSIANSIFMS